MPEVPGNPFLDDVFADAHSRLPGVARIHHSLYDKVVDAVDRMSRSSETDAPACRLGRTILVTAPRAGYGKSHLAARLDRRLAPVATTLSLSLDPSRPITWPVLLHSLLRQLGQCPATQAGPRCLLEEIGRFFLAELAEGNHDPGQAPFEGGELRRSHATLLSPHHNRDLLGWIEDRVRPLCERGIPGRLSDTELRRAELGFWSHLWIDHQKRGDSALEPLRGLSNGEARERLLQLLRIHASARPLLLVADGLDGFFRSEEAGLEIANLLTSIRESVPRSLSLLCLNEDIWTSVFEERLPSAWLDRIAGESEKLREIEPEAAEELVRVRLGEAGLGAAVVAAFLEALRTEHLWIDEEIPLTPRIVIRQARDLWNERIDEFRGIEETGSGRPANGHAPDLSKLTDKVQFFENLRDELDKGPAPTPPVKPPPLPRAAEQPKPTEPRPENPFFVAPGPEESREKKLAGIDSIIAEIRGSGKTVASDPASPVAEPENRKAAPTRPIDPAADPSDPESGQLDQAIEAGEIRLQFGKSRSAAPGQSPGTLFRDEDREAPASRGEIERELREEEKKGLESAPLEFDLERIAKLLRTVGAAHGGLSQTEEHHPSSRRPCLRWVVRGHSSVIGFESPENVYFWNHLLQQALSSDEFEKISAFAHASCQFDPDLFSGFGFTPAVVRKHIDVIEMQDRELSMLYAADRILERYAGRPEGDNATEIIALYLDPLWRRISRPI